MIKHCKLTTQELRARMLAHRNMAKVKVGYNLDPKKTSIELGYSTTQEILESVYAELIQWREKYGDNELVSQFSDEEDFRSKQGEVHVD